jgi:hypothetical protein
LLRAGNRAILLLRLLVLMLLLTVIARCCVHLVTLFHGLLL